MATPVDDVQLDTAELIGTLIESIAFGLALSLGGRTIGIVYRARKNDSYSSLNIIFLVTPILMMMLAAAHVAIDWYRVVGAFLGTLDEVERTIYLELPSLPHYIAKDFVYILATVVGDAVLAYRTYVVWQRSLWTVVFPFLTIGSAFGLGMTAMHLFITNQLDNIFKIKGIVTAYFVLTIATTVVSTGLILLRLWMSERTRKVTRSRLTLLPIMYVLMESGSIYCAVIITVFVLYLNGTNAQVIVLNPINSIIVILFSFVLLRIIDPGKVIIGGTSTNSQLHSRNPPTLVFSRPNRGAQPSSGNVEITMETFIHKTSSPSDHDSFKEDTYNSGHRLGREPIDMSAMKGPRGGEDGW